MAGMFENRGSLIKEPWCKIQSIFPSPVKPRFLHDMSISLIKILYGEFL